MDIYKSGEALVRFAVAEDVQIIADNIRDSDRDEVWASDHITPIQAVSISFKNSAVCWTVENYGKPVAMFGVCPITWAGKEGNIWLLATKDFCHISGKFLKRCKSFISLMLDCYPHLYNFVDCRNEQSIKWLEFCGAKFDEPKPFGVENKLFRYFEFRKQTLTKQEAREKMLSIEERISAMPGAVGADKVPLKHTFVPGAYIREITMPKGMLIVSKLHKTTHPYFVMSGDVSVMTDEGVVRIKAPYSGITKAGTKRILYTHEETVWATVHPTAETDLVKIESDIIAKDYSEITDDSILIAKGE